MNNYANYNIESKIKINNIREWGDFTISKNFIIKSTKGIKQKDINGYIIQRITKLTKVKVYKKNSKKVLTTTKQILKFTNNKVDHMSTSYFEVFIVIGGKSVYKDVFDNSAILRYIEDDDGIFYTNEDLLSSGKIEMEGVSIFIPYNGKDIKDKFKNGDLFGLKWDVSDDTPANGLPYIKSTVLKDKKLLKIIKADIQSNQLVHSVLVKWTKQGDTTMYNDIK
jgi:hypothetical protein